MSLELEELLHQKNFFRHSEISKLWEKLAKSFYRHEQTTLQAQKDHLKTLPNRKKTSEKHHQTRKAALQGDRGDLEIRAHASGQKGTGFYTPWLKLNFL